MLVSAISANRVQAVNLNTKGSDNVSDTAFNFSNASFKKASLKDNTQMVFDSINQWKHFCEQKVVGEKLNVLA